MILLTASATWAQGISVQLDGRTLQFDQPPAMVAGRLLVPLRGIFEALNSDVVYDAPTRSIQATKGSKVIQLQLGSRTAIIDGQTTFLDVPADTIGGRTMVPLRFVSEALGAEVKWEGATKTVKIASSGTEPGGNNGGNQEAGAPSIDQIIHNGTANMSPGQTLDLLVYGEAGSQASFEILGATRTVSIPEVSSGKYQTRWTIPNGLQVNNGVVLVHLQKNGKESTKEASRSITVGGGNVNNDWQLLPSDNSVVNSTRPQLALTFPDTVQQGTVRFYVDGVDHSSSVNVNGRRLTWQPNFDLTASTHQAEVQARTAAGQQISQRWSFRVDANASGGFDIREFRPSSGATAGPRDQVGVLFNQNLRSVNLNVDNRDVTNAGGIQRYANGILWTPTYDLANGQHRAVVQAVADNGQVLNREWTWVVGSSTISNFTISPTQAGTGQPVTIRLNGPAGAAATYSVGDVHSLAMKEMSPGQYEATYFARNVDTGTVPVRAFLRVNNQTLSATAQQQLTFTNGGQSNQLNVTNLSDGATVPPVFAVQGTAQPGRMINVLVEYSSNNLLEVITGQVRTIRHQGQAGGNGVFQVNVNASNIRSGQRFRVTVSDGQTQTQMMLTRQ